MFFETEVTLLVAKKQNNTKLRVIPLGGVDEIGKNMTAIEYGNDIVVIDCGSIFPREDMYGIDLVIPDVTYLERNRDKVRAYLITHGHEDHIGALPYVLPRVNAPVYCTKLTRALIEYKLKEHKFDKAQLNTVYPRDKVKIGCFEVEFIKTNHSIAGAVALAIHTPVGTVVHTGDFKVDYTPVDGEVIDLAKFAELGSKGVLLLMADSTNVEREGYTMSERSVGKALEHNRCHLCLQCSPYSADSGSCRRLRPQGLLFGAQHGKHCGHCKRAGRAYSPQGYVGGARQNRFHTQG